MLLSYDESDPDNPRVSACLGERLSEERVGKEVKRVRESDVDGRMLGTRAGVGPKKNEYMEKQVIGIPWTRMDVIKEGYRPFFLFNDTQRLNLCMPEDPPLPVNSRYYIFFRPLGNPSALYMDVLIWRRRDIRMQLWRPPSFTCNVSWEFWGGIRRKLNGGSSPA